MKKIIFLMLFAVIGWQHALAQSFSNGGINYEVTSPTTVSVGNQFQAATGAIIIPAQVTNNGAVFSVTRIGTNAFYNCYGLTSVTIPNSVTSIGGLAFYFCTGLTSVICNIATPLSISSSVFIGVYLSSCSLSVPGGSISAYQAASFWQNFSSIISVNAPAPIVVLPGTGVNSTLGRAPQGSRLCNRSVYLITQSEMQASGFNGGDVITEIGFNYAVAQNIPTTSTTFGLYLENSNDNTNFKSNIWDYAIAGMTQVRNTNITIPAATGIFTIPFSGGNQFIYNGGSIYVAFDYQNVGARSTTNSALCNNNLYNGIIKTYSSSITVGTSMSNSNSRPETYFTKSSVVSVTPTFNYVAPICSGSYQSELPTVSNEGIYGNWYPPLNFYQTTTYIFTPNAGQSASSVTMTIPVNERVWPYFTQVNAIPSGGSLAPLPSISLNGVVGAWYPALNNMTTTTYTFYPNYGQCSYQASMTITVDPSITPTFNQAAVICSGDSLSALPTTSLNGITGTWSPALNNLATTTYTFTPNAGQTATTATTTITVNPSVTSTFTQVNVICSGAILAALPITSIEGITGIWSPALNNLETTTYSFTPDAGQCATTATMTITVNPSVTSTFTQVNVICSGAILAALPTTSNEGITGTWSPALNNLATTTYTFTPNDGQCATTATMTILVRTAGTISGGNVSVCAVATTLNLSGVSTVFTNSTTLTLNGNSAGSTVVWQRSSNFVNATNAAPVWSNATNTVSINNNVQINGTSLTVSNLLATIWYRTKVTNGSCISYADPVKITVAPVAKNRGFTCPSGACYGDNISFTAPSYTGNSIAWEISTTSATSGFSTVEGQNGLIFTMNNVTYPAKFYVRSVVTSGDCSIARSSVKTITVSPLSVAGTIVGAGTVCSGSNANLKLLGFTGSVQWMYSTDGATYYNVPFLSTTLGYQNPSGASTFTTTSTIGRGSSYAVNNITGTTYFKAVVKSGVCSTTESNVVVCNTGTTATAPSLSVESASVCSGSATSLYLPLNVGLVRFQKSNNWSSATPTWTIVTLTMTQTLYNGAYGVFSTGVLTTSTAYRAMASIGSCAPVVYSDIVVIGVGECNISRAIETPTESKTPFAVVAYPNPSDNVFNFKINGANDDEVSILVFDMLGKQIENKIENANEIENVSLGQNYATGVYNVIVSQGMNTKTVRLVKK